MRAWRVGRRGSSRRVSRAACRRRESPRGASAARRRGAGPRPERELQTSGRERVATVWPPPFLPGSQSRPAS